MMYMVCAAALIITDVRVYLDDGARSAMMYMVCAAALIITNVRVYLDDGAS